MLPDDLPGEKRVAGDILRHVQDTPQDECQQDDSRDDGDGDIADSRALYDERLMRIGGGQKNSELRQVHSGTSMTTLPPSVTGTITCFRFSVRSQM